MHATGKMINVFPFLSHLTYDYRSLWLCILDISLRMYRLWFTKNNDQFLHQTLQDVLVGRYFTLVKLLQCCLKHWNNYYSNELLFFPLFHSFQRWKHNYVKWYNLIFNGTHTALELLTFNYHLLINNKTDLFDICL